MKTHSTTVEIWVPTSAVISGAGGSVFVASYRKRDSGVPADQIPIYGSQRRRLQVSTTADLTDTWIYGAIAAVPPSSIVYEKSTMTYRAAVRPVQVVPDLLPLRSHRCAPMTVGDLTGAQRILALALSLSPGQISPTTIVNVTIPSVELSEGVRPRLQETFAAAWDAGIETRAGGTIFSATTSNPLDAGAIVDVYRGTSRMVQGADYALTGQTVTFLDGSKPIAGETVIVQYTPA